jgi:hypothetical protein
VPATSFQHLFLDGTNRFYNPVPIAPSETLQDPVGKLRVSTPQALIDTDFEYSTQSTKWESLNLLNNRPSAFYNVTSPLTVTGVAGAGTRVVTVTTASPPSVGTPIYVQNTTDPLANGWFLVDTVSAGVNFTYVASNTIASGSIYDVSKTYIFSGNFYTGSGIPLTGTTAFTFSGTTITCTTTNSHGLTVGDAIYVVGTTGGTPAPNGSWVVQTTPTSNTFTFVVATAPTVAIANTAGSTNLYPRPYGSIIHRSFDGGVGFTAGYPYAGNQLIRQTRRYFRYQSGKGIQFSTGSCLKPAFNVDKLTSSGNTVTVFLKSPHNLNGNFVSGSGIPVSASVGAAFTNNTSFNKGLTVTCTTTNPHGLQVGDTVFVTGTTASTSNPPNGTWLVKSIPSTTTFNFDVLIAPVGTITATAGATSTLFPSPGGPYVVVSGSTDPAYNGTFLVQTVPTDLTFTYTTTITPSVTTAPGFPLNVNPFSWWGARNRVGLFDEQNGFFFEFDGQTLYAVKRSCTTQISGTIAVNTNTVTVTGTNTLFSSQLVPGDYIVIRGMTYLVQSISSDTSLVIYPEYRSSSNISSCVVSKRVEEKYPQSQWNIDRCDGTGSTGFNLDLTKMQMMYVDFAWYGAGAIRFGFKDQKGEIIYCHRIANSNRNTEAYMRSGNMCARYESNTLTFSTVLSATLANTETNTLNVVSTTNFPQSGVLAVNAPGNTGAAIEYIRYNSKTATTFTGLTRALATLSGPGNLTGGGGNSTAQTFTYSATAPIQVSAFPAQSTSTLSHWGSAVIMDGRYDDDKSYVFQANQLTPASNIAQNNSVALMSIRLAPSVDSGLTGTLGARDLINRMQLTLRQMDVVATGSAAIFRVELILNGNVSSGSFTAAGGSSLAQTCFHSGATVTGGESIFSFFMYTPSVTQQDLILVRDLGTSILGGGVANTVPTSSADLYPDGPDVVTVKVTNVSAQATNTIQVRLSWTEAQA